MSYSLIIGLFWKIWILPLALVFWKSLFSCDSDLFLIISASPMCGLWIFGPGLFFWLGLLCITALDWISCCVVWLMLILVVVSELWRKGTDWRIVDLTLSSLPQCPQSLLSIPVVFVYVCAWLHCVCLSRSVLYPNSLLEDADTVRSHLTSNAILFNLIHLPAHRLSRDYQTHSSSYLFCSSILLGSAPILQTTC